VRGLGSEGGQDFPIPTGVEFVEVDPETGLRAGFGCPGDKEVFLAGTAPRESCTLTARRYPDERERTKPAEERSRPQRARPQRSDPRPRTRRTPNAFERWLDDILDAIGVTP